MRRKAQRPEKSGSEDDLHGYALHHPAFGMIQVSRVQAGGRGMRLHGSELRHTQLIHLAITHGGVNRNLNQEWYHPTQPIVELYMSEAQWASFVSSFNMGGGTPVTLTDAPAEPYKLEALPEIEEETLTEKFRREIRQDTAKYVERAATGARRLQALADAPGPVSKTELKAVARELCLMLENMPDNMAFMQKQLTEAMENTVQAAKTEVEAFTRNTLLKAGLEHFADKQLTELPAERKPGLLIRRKPTPDTPK